MRWWTYIGGVSLVMSFFTIAHTEVEGAAKLVPEIALQTRDRLRLELSPNGQVVGCKLDEHRVQLLAPGGFAVVDYHHLPAPDKPVSQSIQGTARTDGTKVRFQGTAPGSDLQLQATFSTPGNCIRVDGELKDTSGRDRAIGLRFELPLDATGWTWHDDIEEHRVVEAPTVYRNTYDGLTGEGPCSVYPWSALSGPEGGLSFGLPLEQGPRIFVIAYDQGRHIYSVTFYLGLTAKADKFRSVAPFSFVLYRHDPVWGMRSAAERYYALFPQSFRKRATSEGSPGWGGVEWVEEGTHRLLCSYSDFGKWDQKPEDASDFGDHYRYIYHTGGCYQGFSYASASGQPPSDGEVMKLLPGSDDLFKKVARDENGHFVYIAEPSRQSNGRWWIELRLNEDPEIVSDKADATKKSLEKYAREPGRQPFEVVLSADAIEGYVGNQRGLDYSPEHIRIADYPPSFGQKNLKVALINTIWDFLHQVWGPLSEQYQVLVCGNSNQYEQAFTIPFVDLPMFEHYYGSIPQWDRYIRTMSRQKTIRSIYYLQETMPQHLKRRLGYAILPSVYAVPNVDSYRGWYRQYVPAIEELSAAGWQPIPYAHTGEADVVVERFGDYRTHDLHFTFRNYGEKTKEISVALDLAGLGIPQDQAQRLLFCDLLRGFEPQPLPAGTWKVRVEPDDSRAFWIGTPEDLARRGLTLADRGLRRVERDFRADLSEANRAALGEAGKRVGRASQLAPDVLDQVEAIQVLLDQLEPAVATQAPIDRAKVFYRIRSDLSTSLLGLLGLRVEAPRSVEGGKDASTCVSVTIANARSHALTGLRFSVLSPWKECVESSKAPGAPTEIGVGEDRSCSFSLFAPQQPERGLLPFLLQCKGRSNGRPFTLRVPVDLVVR